MPSGVFKAPSSSANVGPGYDVFSIALDNPYLVVKMNVEDGEGITVFSKGKYAAELSSNPEENTGARAVYSLLKKKGLRKKVEITYEAGIPPRKGLGSSGAEAAAAVYGLDRLLGLGLTAVELVEAGAAAEPGCHPDNVAASVFGGFVACLRDVEGITVYRLEPTPDLGVLVVVPDVEKKSTMEARRAVPENLGLKTHVELTARVAVAAMALSNADLNTFFRAVSQDPFVEYNRANAGVYGKGVDGKKLMEEKMRLLKKYNVAEVVSGAGPSRVLFFKLSENTQPPGYRPVDAAAAEVVSQLEKNGYKILEMIETRPNIAGCVETV
ncbi:MAG: hypothetical protein RMK31_06690 [Candidatus Caldarchaeum sp.]|nr:hypothetical protein [Candidatus Caldarchaeum sp.]MDW7977613.1 hypothetical protein [Candidatus Caldarchaeum sp.]MDW8360251.1 hypothetical protein [Candidatus Caldarchaeum sp.]